jgi:Ca-activated chloride channel family protein
MRLLLSVLFVCLTAVGFTQGPSPAAEVITGVVADPSGRPVPGAVVELRDGARVVHTTTTDTNGSFRFEQVAAGAYQLRASSPLGTTSVAIRVSSESFTPVRLVIAPSTRSERSFSTGTAVVDAGRLAREQAQAPPMTSYAPSPATPYPNASMRMSAADLMQGPTVGFNTEAYSKIDENGFHRALESPLSTFSIDVDTASYANVRRFLNGGALPPADAVRIEELVNYFRFDYESPTGDRPVAVTTEVGPCPWAPSHRLVLVGLNARPITDGRTPPRNLVFLLDVSGSMSSPDKLPLVQTAMRMLTATLAPADRVAIVVYAGASGVALPSTSGAHRARIEQAIADLRPGGSTNGAAGIRQAYDIAAQSFIEGGINRVILATDGDFNVGTTNQGELVRLIEEKRERGVFLSVLGVGTGNLKDSTMEQLANRGNGNYSYLDSLHEARRVLIAEAGSTLMTVAKDVKVQVEFNPARVGAYRLIGYENRVLAARDFNDDRKDAGEMGAGHTVTALYEIVPPGADIDAPGIDPLRYQSASQRASRSGAEELLTVKVRYKAPDGDTSQLMTAPVRDRAGVTTSNLGFASAVAQFGMLLRGSEHAGRASWTDAAALARRHRGPDADGYRAEFIRLIDLAAALGAQQRH